MSATAHDMNCPRRARAHEDAAARIADAYNLHLIAGGTDAAVGHFIACAMVDGRSDGVLYDTRREAVRHQRHNEAQYVFIRIGPANMTACEAASLLFTQRKLHQRGMRLTDRDHRAGGRVVIPRLTVEDQFAQIRQILTGSAPTNLILPN